MFNNFKAIRFLINEYLSTYYNQLVPYVMKLCSNDFNINKKLFQPTIENINQSGEFVSDH